MRPTSSESSNVSRMPVSTWENTSSPSLSGAEQVMQAGGFSENFGFWFSNPG